MSTRKLIIAALVCGMAILLAGALQFLQIANDQHQGSSSGGSAPAASTVGSNPVPAPGGGSHG